MFRLIFSSHGALDLTVDGQKQVAKIDQDRALLTPVMTSCSELAHMFACSVSAWLDGSVWKICAQA